MNINLDEYLEELRKLCAIDSGNFNAEGTNAMADYFEERYKALGLNVIRRYMNGNDFAPFLEVSNCCESDTVDALMVGHMDTVFPVGEGAERPFSVDADGIGRGPGCIDCKGGCLMMYYLVREWIREGVNFNFCVAMNSDEEKGSKLSRNYFEILARRSKCCYVFEPARQNDEFVSARKGGANFIFKFHGIAAHSGVNPWDGASAIVEAAYRVNELQDLFNDIEKGTSLNIGRISGGANNGQVPDYCEFTVSMRSIDPDEVSRLRGVMDEMIANPHDKRVTLEIETVSLRPAMAIHEKTEKLLELLKDVGKKENIATEHVVTGGGSDGNFIAPFGVATLDGCGPGGHLLHTKNEYLKVATIEPRMRIMDRLIKSAADTF